MKRVLIVDDEPYVLNVLNHFLTGAGFEVSEAANGEAALEAVAQTAPQVVLTDVQMPRLNGQDLCNELAKRFPDRDRLVIVMTSRTDPELRQWAATLDNVQFVEKPVSPRGIVDRITAHFQPPVAPQETVA